MKCFSVTWLPLLFRFFLQIQWTVIMNLAFLVKEYMTSPLFSTEQLSYYLFICFLLWISSVYLSTHPSFATSIGMPSLLILSVFLPQFCNRHRFVCVCISKRTFGAFSLGYADFLYWTQFSIANQTQLLVHISTQWSFLKYESIKLRRKIFWALWWIWRYICYVYAFKQAVV